MRRVASQERTESGMMMLDVNVAGSIRDSYEIFCLGWRSKRCLTLEVCRLKERLRASWNG
jgi:hypothetical protein